jgi:N-formylglutamate amidohydrolase
MTGARGRGADRTRRVQHAVDRRFNRARYDAETTVTAFAVRLKGAIDLDAVHGDLASLVQTALETAHISIWTSQPDWSSRNPPGPGYE